MKMKARHTRIMCVWIFYFMKQFDIHDIKLKAALMLTKILPLPLYGKGGRNC